MALNNINSTTQFSKRAYISREDAYKRRVLNEAEVMEMLSKYGFHKYLPSELSLDEEISLFSNADIIVGPHGQGLTSCYLMRDATLVELFPRGGETEHWFITSNEVDINYEYLLGEPVRPSHRLAIKKGPANKDILINVDDLEKIIDSLDSNYSG